MSRLVDRVSPTDMVSLASDTVAAPMQVGAVIVLAAGPLSDLAAIESAIAERIQAIPRLRQRLVRVPLGMALVSDRHDPARRATAQRRSPWSIRRSGRWARSAFLDG